MNCKSSNKRLSLSLRDETGPEKRNKRKKCINNEPEIESRLAFASRKPTPAISKTNLEFVSKAICNGKAKKRI